VCRDLYTSVISGEGLHLSARPSSIFLKISIMRVFSKKQTTIFYLGQKASHKKTTGLPTFRFSTISQRVFIAETCAWMRWKGILLKKIQKIKKLPMNNNYMMYVCSKSFACLNFFFN
jgi:hypothetical protein